MRAFVTGATGFVGINLVRELVREGWDVVALHRRGPGLAYIRDLPVTLVEGEITDIDSLRRAMPDTPDAVFHVAGDTSLWSGHRERQTRVNVDGTRNVAAVALEKRAKKFVQTSSVAAFGHHHERVTEATPSNALESPTNYFRTKRLAELEVERAIERGLDAVFINPAHIVGPYDAGNWSRLVRLVAERKLPGIPPGRASWCHVREVARAHIASAARGRTGDRYLLGGIDATYVEAIAVIGRITGQKVPDKAMQPLLLKSFALLNEAGAILRRREPDVTIAGARLVTENVLCDCSKAMRELGYRASSLEEMFGDAYEWLRSERLVV